MKKLLVILLLISFSSMAGMTGHWEKVSKSSSFIIDLVQSGEHVSGKYCFITNNGNRIDCPEKNDEDNISGTINNGVANIKFESTFGGSGVAVAKLNKNKLIYSIKNKTPFIEANMSVPDEIELGKK